MLRVGVLASGEGTNLQALQDACASGYAAAEIVGVLSNRSEARVLRRAERTGIEGVFVDPADASDRAEYDRMLLSHLKRLGVELVCGAGYMRLLSPEFVATFEHRILNVHPSLLPAFPGLHAIAQAWEWGARVTGVTVHIVDAELDHGPIVCQRAVDVRADDTLESLTERIHLTEYAIYPKALRLWAAGAVRIEGRRVEVDADVPDPPWAGGLPPGLKEE